MCTLIFPSKIWAKKWQNMYLKKLKMELAFDPAIPLLGKYLKGPKTLIQNKHPSVHCSVVYNCQDMEAAQVSIRR